MNQVKRIARKRYLSQMLANGRIKRHERSLDFIGKVQGKGTKGPFNGPDAQTLVELIEPVHSVYLLRRKLWYGR